MSELSGGPSLERSDRLLMCNCSLISEQVGDVVKTECEEEFACDMVLLSSSDEEGSCFITTANLDGETNLKVGVIFRLGRYH
jgi:phospholipid-translocating ATPase